MKYKIQNHFLRARIVPLLAISLFIISLNMYFILNLNINQGNNNFNQEDMLLDLEKSCDPKSLIFIDDSNPCYNWSKTANDNDWCSGQGTAEDPFVIENLILNAENFGSCIIIKHSSVHFRIENCILLNSSLGELMNDNMDLLPWNVKAGIILEDVQNGIILNNDISNNYGIGLFVFNSDNNGISGNIINNNKDGIVMLCSNFNNITENQISNNLEDGINLIFCDFNIISGNSINNNKNGIILYFSNHNTISGNNLIGNDVFIFQESCIGNIIQNNIYWEDIPDEEDEISNIPPLNFIPFLILAAAIGLAGGLSAGIVVQRHRTPRPAGAPLKKGLKGKQMLVPPIVDAKEYQPDLTRINLNGNETINKIKEEDTFLRREAIEQLRQKEKRYEAAKEEKKEKLHEILNNNNKPEKNLTIIETPEKEAMKKEHSKKKITKKGDIGKNQ